ncbi:GTP cyclohydrolase FolE2 [Pseudoxanthomonas dokdonensis]|uniref:GTP cyclohydrolase FolE2 n=1 Tax=Pseudoxanthomonas dokdonensis TaxID=344882 RepID=A0A0R0D0K1_9GAMM|nr:GTP cyclohydrolase FolE2 [Pseudoxanthomonas dokdonensis]KRG70920.1 GTP cyclohydrolase [Pseudoxanthomonas dokdonensis]
MSTPRPVLADVADQSVPHARALDWVGMEGIALPIRLADVDGQPVMVPASIDLSVNLTNPDARGIHMSRLYLQLQQGLASEVITPAGLRHLLSNSVASQQGLASQARLVIRYEALLQRRALESEFAGWKRYPVEIEATLVDEHLQLALSLAVEYSSTCPASAALSRQANAARFDTDFADATPLSPQVVSDWLASERGMAATPHAQRSRASVRVQLRPQFDELPLVALIDALEAVLATPVQTAVKRVDEQAFARLNAENLMFCEDAARRVASVLSTDPRVEAFDATVAHFESLHPHDAVARVSGRGP